MGMTSFVITIVLLLLDILGTVRLQKNLHSRLTIELAFLVAILVLWLIAVLALAWNKKWAWSLNTILFSSSTANLLWIYTNVGSSLTFILTLGINVFAIIIGILAIDIYRSDTEPESLETYEAENSKKKKKPRRKAENSEEVDMETT